MAKSEQDQAIEQMRQRLASAQAVLDMRGGGGEGDSPTRRVQLPETTLRGLVHLPAHETDNEDRGILPAVSLETVKTERSIVPEAMPSGEIAPKREGLSQDELFRAKMGRENAGLPGIGTVPLPPVGSVSGASGAQQTVSLPTSTVKPPALPDQDELFRRKMGLENRGLPTSALVEALTYHRANYKPPELPERMPIPTPEGQRSDGWEVQRGLTPDEQGTEQEKPDADQRNAGVSGGAGSLFGNLGRGVGSFVGDAASHTFSRFWSHPGNFLPGGGRGSFLGGGTSGEQWSDSSSTDALTKAIETLTKSIDNLTKITEQGKQSDHTQHGHSAGMSGKPSATQAQSPTKADKKSGIDPALIRQGAAVIARFIGMGK